MTERSVGSVLLLKGSVEVISDYPIQ